MLDADINETTDEVLSSSSSAIIESPLPTIITMDTNVDGIDNASPNEIDEQEVLQSSNYGTFSDLAQEHDVHKAISAAGEQQPATAAIDSLRMKI